VRTVEVRFTEGKHADATLVEHSPKLNLMMRGSQNEPTKMVPEATTRNVRQNMSSGAHSYFWLLAAGSCLAFWAPIKNLVEFALTHDYGSHTLLIAPLSIFLVYLRRQEMFSDIETNTNRKRTIIASSGLLLLGLSFLLGSQYPPLSAEKLSLEILSLVLLWISAFVFCYGEKAFMRGRFPLLFLLLLVPFPEFVVGRAIFALQAGSSDVAYGLLRILNVPVLKEGFILRLPMINLEVAKECSGIRSSIALLVTVLVAGEFALRSSWRRLILVVSIIPILILKNGVRIVTIYLLTAYVNPAFLHGWMHTSGGVVFYLLGLVALIPVTAVLRRWEGADLTLSPMHELAQVTSG
jgi:exosortase